jgi:hypothetical protein
MPVMKRYNIKVGYKDRLKKVIKFLTYPICAVDISSFHTIAITVKTYAPKQTLAHPST